MLIEYLEEDFRFATKSQVAAYLVDELRFKPHMSGYDLSQMLDQIDGRVLASGEAGKSLLAAIQAPGGTALCLAKHLMPEGCSNGFPPELILYVTEFFDDSLIAELRVMPHVREVLCGRDPRPFPTSLYDCPGCCVVLADEHSEWPRDLTVDKPCSVIDYDPEKKLSLNEGEYFMNSNIWVNRGN